MRRIFLFTVVVILLPVVAFAQPIGGGPPEGGPGDGGSATSILDDVNEDNLQLTVTLVGNGIYELSSSCTFTASCSSTAQLSLEADSKLTICDQVGGAVSLYSETLTAQVTVVPGAVATWTLDNGVPGPPPTTVPGPHVEKFKSSSTITGFRGTALIDSDGDTKIVPITE